MLPDYLKQTIIQQNVVTALKEDIGHGDVTASLIDIDTIASATVICRDHAVIAGIAWFNEVFQQVDSNIELHWHVADGDIVDANTTLCDINGKARHILTAERAALNFLQLLSATASATKRYVDAISDTSAKILDTRKTIPGLRAAQKYAVTCGGGQNHRIGLYDRVLIKENHIAAAGSIQAAIDTARQLHPALQVEVETENLDELNKAQDGNADFIMLDNYSLDNMRTAVQSNTKKIPLEASGGVNMETVRAIAETGVDFISIGEITKDIKAIDLSLRFG